MESLAHLERYRSNKNSPPTPIAYRGYLVTGVVPESASQHDRAFQEWATQADEVIEAALARGFDKAGVEEALREATHYAGMK